jgi:hypothetical protein
MITLPAYLFLLKAIKLKMLSRGIEKRLSLSGLTKGYVELSKLFFFIFIIAHIMVNSFIYPT